MLFLVFHQDLHFGFGRLPAESKSIDHRLSQTLVRSPEQYPYLRDYIAKNPEKARLKVGEYYYMRYDV
jgi:hypothetical protein